MSSSLMVHCHLCPKEKPSKPTTEHNPLGWFYCTGVTDTQLVPPLIQELMMMNKNTCVKMGVALAIMVLVCEKVSMAFRATLVQNTKLK